MALLALDSDVASLYLRGHPAVTREILSRVDDTIAVPIVVAQELLAGWLAVLTRRQARDRAVRAYAGFRRTLDFLTDFPLLDFDQTAGERFDLLRAAHRRIGQNDLRIAAIALANGARLVTRNTAHFRQIAGLAAVDWT